MLWASGEAGLGKSLSGQCGAAWACRLCSCTSSPLPSTPATSSACAACGLPCGVSSPVCLCLHPLSRLWLWPGHGPFLPGVSGVWKGPQSSSPGARFDSITVADSLGPWTLGLSFPICNMTRCMVRQMFFSSSRVSSNDVQSPEYKASKCSWPWLELASLPPQQPCQFGGQGVPCGPLQQAVQAERPLAVLCAVC